MNQPTKIVHDAGTFRCKCWEPMFKVIHESYITDEPKPISFDLGSGGASGKTQQIARNIIFWLPEINNDKALIILNDAAAIAKMRGFFIHILSEQGYTYTVKRQEHAHVLKFGNDNAIYFMQTKTSSNDQIKERFKMPIIPDDSFKFVWWEEFESTYMTLRDMTTYADVRGRIRRLCRRSVVEFYSYNTPNNKGAIINEWINKGGHIKINNSIYDLPPRFQDANTLAFYEELRNDPQRKNIWRNIALGEIVGTTALAYPNIKTVDKFSRYYDYEIYVDNGTDHATTFTLFGFTTDGKMHPLTMYYHSGENEGYKDPTEYAQDFAAFFVKCKKALGIVKNVEVFCDDKSFALLLANRGYDAQSISLVINKDMANFLKLTRLAFDKSILEIPITNELNIMHQQLANLQTVTHKYRNGYKTIPHKTEGKNVKEQYKMHAVDPIHYAIMRNQERLQIFN